MFHQIKVLVSTITLVAPACLALAVPHLDARVVGPPPCEVSSHYKITSHQSIQGPTTMGPFSCPSAGTCTLTVQEGYEVSVAVDIGAGLDLDFGAIEGLTGGLGISVELTTTTSTEEAGQVACFPGGDWTCGLIITPGLMQISGQKTSISSSPLCGKGPSGPYTVTYPAVTNHMQNLNLQPCICQNFDGWADAGTLTKCPQDCPR